jgi:hypothetical protein
MEYGTVKISFLVYLYLGSQEAAHNLWGYTQPGKLVILFLFFLFLGKRSVPVGIVA